MSSPQFRIEVPVKTSDAHPWGDAVKEFAEHSAAEVDEIRKLLPAVSNPINVKTNNAIAAVVQEKVSRLAKEKEYSWFKDDFAIPERLLRPREVWAHTSFTTWALCSGIDQA